MINKNACFGPFYRDCYVQPGEAVIKSAASASAASPPPEKNIEKINEELPFRALRYIIQGFAAKTENRCPRKNVQTSEFEILK